MKPATKKLLYTYIDWVFLLFFILVSGISIIYFLNTQPIYAIFHNLNLNLSFVNHLIPKDALPKLVIKKILLFSWVGTLILLPLWLYLHKSKKHYELKELSKILAEQDRFDKLLGHMITDSWGRITWASEVFQKIFKIYPHYSKMKLNFIDVLKEFPEIEIDERIIKSIEHNFMQQKSDTIELNLKIGAYNNALKITYMKLFSSFYIWQVMLVNVNYSALSYNFAMDVLDNLPLATVIISPSGKIIYYNLMFMKLFKVQQYNLENSLKFNNFVVNTNYEQIVKENKGFDANGTFSTKYIFKDLNNKHFEAVLLQEPFFKTDAVGLRYIRAIVLPTALEKFLQVGNILMKSPSYNLNNIYNHAPFGVIIFKTDNTILNLNVYIKDLFKISTKEQITKLDDLLGGYTSQIQENLKKGSVKLNVELEIGNELKYLELSLFPLEDEEQIMYVNDLTQQKDLEGQVKLSQGLQTIGQIASAVAHDFNNLLTAIMSFTYFLKERFDEDDPSILELEQIKQNANRAKVMIKQLLTFSRKQELSPVVFEVNSEISDLISTLLRLLGDRVKLDFQRNKHSGKILMDKVQFHQILTNLVINAKDAMKKGGTLKISTKNINLKESKEGVLGTIIPGSYVCVQLKDQGEGIKPENLKLIFQSHFSTKGEKGNGLGLATVMKIITDSAGFIDVVSTVGKGSTFSLYFPKEESGAEVTENIEIPVTYKDLTGSETVLLVEDETPVRMVCSRLLKQKGYNVIEAESGTEALEILAKNKISNLDLIVSDVMMPGISGPELISRVRDIFPEMKAILISGYTEDILDDINSDVSLKGIDFLAKPFTPDVFATKIKLILTSGK